MFIFEEIENDKMELLKHAIDNKYAISFWYKGVAFRNPNNKQYTRQNWRFAQPTGLGFSPKTGKWMLRAWQTNGVTNTAGIQGKGSPAWKTFLVDEMSSITIMNGKDGGYNAFQQPNGYEFNPNGDGKMRGGHGKGNVGGLQHKIDTSKQLPPDLSKQPIQEKHNFSDWIINKILKTH